MLAKAVQGTQTSVFVGLAAALLATLIGTLLGAFAGFFGGRIGDFLEWLYSVFTAIPDILLILSFAAIFGRGIGRWRRSSRWWAGPACTGRCARSS